MNRFSHYSLWLAVWLLLSSCSLLPSRPASPALHDFGVTGSPARESAPAAWASVKVAAPEWLQTENIRYRLLYADPTHVHFYSQDRWIAPPPALLAQRLSLDSGSQGDSLKIELMEFEQVFDGPQQARVILAFRATAYQPGAEAVYAEKLFRFSRPTASADAQGAVTATHDVVEEAVKSAEVWLQKSR